MTVQAGGGPLHRFSCLLCCVPALGRGSTGSTCSFNVPIGDPLVWAVLHCLLPHICDGRHIECSALLRLQMTWRPIFIRPRSRFLVFCLKERSEFKDAVN